MGTYSVGEVVLVMFPFSNLSGQKLRPALVVAVVEFGNLVLCQITSRPYSSKESIRIEASDFQQGGLPITSYVRPDKLFTADGSIIQSSAGHLNTKTTTKILNHICTIFTPAT